MTNIWVHPDLCFHYHFNDGCFVSLPRQISSAQSIETGGHCFVFITEKQPSAIATTWILYSEKEDLTDSITAHSIARDTMAVPTKWE